MSLKSNRRRQDVNHMVRNKRPNELPLKMKNVALAEA
jgi:hypothetical protein